MGKYPTMSALSVKSDHLVFCGICNFRCLSFFPAVKGDVLGECGHYFQFEW